LEGTPQTATDLPVPLTEYTWKFRYPGEIDEPQREEAEEALAAAQRLYEAIVSPLPAKPRRRVAQGE